MMKIGWFTPLSGESAIARFSVAVTAELSQIADVELCHFEPENVRKASVPVVGFSSADAVSGEALKRYDVVVYNFGNYLPYHCEIYRLSRRHGGIAILHDFVMHHFFAAYYLEHLRDPEGYSLLMEELYGEEGRAWEDARVWESDEVVRFPMFEEAARGTRGVVTHSRFFRDAVSRAFAGPIRHIPLAYDALAGLPERNAIGVPDDAILVVTIGHVNSNKRIEDVLVALGRIRETGKRVIYAIIGACPAETQERLAAVAEASGAGDVRFLGHVADQELKSYLARADICVNLRSPAFEGASASAIEEMLAAKPLIVNNTGFFGELPDDCVVKIALEREGELAAQLKRLVMEPEARAALGDRARRFAEREFSAGRYAREFLDFAWEVRSASPLLGLADQVATELGRMGVTGEAEVVDTVAREIHDLFGAHKASPPLWRA
jgi:glycosyltransferase involved in cell wall biosynthesis